MPGPQKFADIDAYIATLPESTQAVVEQARRLVLEALPGATEAITYNIPTFVVGDRRVVHLAGYAQHISLYPAPAGDAAYEAAIAPHRSGASTLRFAVGEQLPAGLIQESVRLLAAG